MTAVYKASGQLPDNRELLTIHSKSDIKQLKTFLRSLLVDHQDSRWET